MLERLFEGSLADAERADVERHIDGCPSCSATLAELARLFGSATWGSRPGGSQTWDSGSASRSEHASSAELGRYRLGRRLGAGGMGMVFEADDLELHRRVALKLLYADPSADLEQTRAQLLREARAMAQTNHPNVVAVYDVGRIGEQVFLAMELVEGSTLAAWLRSARPRAEILRVFVMAGRGLEAAHATGLVHRDFKPDNVLIGGDGRARVTDFGLALVARASGGPGSSAGVGASADVRASMTVSTERGATVGTPAYMAPEQLRGQPAHRSVRVL
jgi:serine/threonine protein kinase